ncbi:tripartite tricarboxylate transporter substrate binding protein [uncultured Ramlibacter sp.]|uniref:Bug family tripartite tricarboxylate transporter substrate binding protein n=1 Tax=uncultured Ramlibacter sp. TaxID=260755 RepID=UPI00262F3C49|nr:tripartite tricarboxylate transporter substrate binding protein [uncultured Ramlibacter sp.]
MNPSHLSRRTLLAGAALALTGVGAQAQTWPAKPIRIVVAGPAGANADIIARTVADGLSRELGQPVIVDPKPGAAGAIATAELLQAPRDGYTFMVGVNSLVSEIPHIVKLRWDMAKELRPVAELARGGLVLVGNPGFPAKDLKELVAHAKAHPGKVNYASYSAGTLSHVLGLALNQAAGIHLEHVAYKGSTPALADVMGNHVPLMFDAVPTSLPLIRSGKLKAFAVSTPRRTPLLPDVPTFAELGYPTLEALAWMGLWSTPDAPAAVQERVRAATLKVLADPALRQRMQDTGFDVGQPRTPQEMEAGLKADYERVGAMLKAINFKPE